MAVGPALADVELESSDPAAGATVATPPTTIILEFSGPLVEDKSSFALRGADGTIDTGRVSEDDETVMTLAGLDLAPGQYEIRWTAGSEDGHIVRGRLTFAVLEPTPAPATPTPVPSTAPSVAPTTAPTAPPVETAPARSGAPTASPDPGAPVASTGDVLLPIVAGLVLVGVVGFLVLRRGRPA